MAASVQWSVIGSMPQSIPKGQAVGHSSNLLRSQFLGSGRLYVPSVVTVKHSGQQQAAKVRGVNAVRGASFFEKLGQLFQSNTNTADEEHVISVYEINELDRKSPAILYLGPDAQKGGLPTFADLVPYTNKVYGPSGKDFLGNSAGQCICINNNTPKGIFYETTYTHYIGQYGQLSGMGPYYSNADSEMVVTGGTGIFKGARGIVKVHNVQYPIKLLYTYYITGIQTPPAELTMAVVPLPKEVSPKKSTATASA